MTTATIAVLGYDGAQVLDMTGPVEVFTAANVFAGDAAYRVVMVSHDGRDVVTGSGLRIGADARWLTSRARSTR